MREKFTLLMIAFITLAICSSAAAFSKIERTVNKLIYERKFDEAYAFLNSKKYDNDITLRYKGYLLGSGVLSTGVELCGAITKLEEVYERNKFISYDLDFLYGGDWAAIAAIEGNLNALYDMGYRIYTTRHILDQKYVKALAIKEAYQHFYNAGLLGHLYAGQVARQLEDEYPKLDFSKYKQKFKFRKINCPTREQNPRKDTSYFWQNIEIIDVNKYKTL